MSPFMTHYRYHSPSITSPLKWFANVQVVKDRYREPKSSQFIEGPNIVITQNRMKQQTNQNYSERAFEIEN